MKSSMTDVLAPEKLQDPFDNLRMEVLVCQRCPLGCIRTNAVFGAGNRNADLLFVGEAPGAQEDLVGMPFVGRSGQLLTRTLESHGICRDDVFISNIVKCRPPDNRDPKPAEVQACSPYLFAQIDMIKPVIVCALGRHAAATLLERKVKITEEHGQWMKFHDRDFLIALHPSAALRMPRFKEQFEHDIAVLAERFHKLRERRNLKE